MPKIDIAHGLIILLVISLVFSGCTKTEDRSEGQSKDNKVKDGKPFYIQADPRSYISTGGAYFPVNRVNVVLRETDGKNVAQEIADSVHGIIVGFAPSINLYVIEVPSNTPEQLDQIISKLEKENRILQVNRDYKTAPF